MIVGRRSTEGVITDVAGGVGVATVVVVGAAVSVVAAKLLTQAQKIIIPANKMRLNILFSSVN
ncbi:MAG: hypothetical protein ACD_42C00483G0004 [uncultured bacterium]|nr:MAG: hypothetical protein ACD_42C00483G0004 [uncultured bacterium]